MKNGNLRRRLGVAVVLGALMMAVSAVTGASPIAPISPPPPPPPPPPSVPMPPSNPGLIPPPPIRAGQKTLEEIVAELKARREAEVAAEARAAAGLQERALIPAPVKAVEATQPAATPVVVEGRWVEVVKKLASADFAEREAGQKELDGATYRELDQLRQLGTAASDPEAQARIQARVTALEEDVALNPPPISFNVTNGSLADVGAAFKQALGIEVQANGSGPFTLNVKEKPFWEVYEALALQHGMTIQMYDTVRLYQSEPGLRKMVAVGSVAVFPQTIARTVSVDLQQDAAQQVATPVLSFTYTVAMDPRVKLAGAYQPQLLEVVDDLGNVLLSRQPAVQNTLRTSRNQGVWQLGEQLALPEKPGKKIASAKGQIRVRVMLAEEKMEVAAVETKVKQSFEIGGRSVTFDRLDIGAARTDITISSKPVNGPEVMMFDAAGMRVEPTMVSVTLMDAAGVRMWQGNVNNSSGIGMGGNTYKTPFKAILSVPTKTKDMTVSFEMKDLPLP